MNISVGTLKRLDYPNEMKSESDYIFAIIHWHLVANMSLICANSVLLPANWQPHNTRLTYEILYDQIAGKEYRLKAFPTSDDMIVIHLSAKVRVKEKSRERKIVLNLFPFQGEKWAINLNWSMTGTLCLFMQTNTGNVSDNDDIKTLLEHLHQEMLKNEIPRVPLENFEQVIHDHKIQMGKEREDWKKDNKCKNVGVYSAAAIVISALCC